jgi:hypothetical protein
LGLWIAVTFAAATALALGGCGGGDDAADAGSTAGTATAPATASFNAEDAVIALSDLPTGWAVDPEEDDDDDDGFCGRDEDIPSLVGFEAASKAEAQFAEGGDVPVLVNFVGAYAPGGAEISFAKFEEIVTDCTSFESDGTTLKVAPVSFPEQGDDSVPLLVSGEVEGFTVSFYFVFVRVADGITLVGYGGLAPAVAEVEKYVGLAVTKLEQAQGISS